MEWYAGASESRVEWNENILWTENLFRPNSRRRRMGMLEILAKDPRICIASRQITIRIRLCLGRGLLIAVRERGRVVFSVKFEIEYLACQTGVGGTGIYSNFVGAVPCNTSS